MDYFRDDFKWDFKANRSFRVIIVGAGIAGLAAGIGMCTFSLGGVAVADGRIGLKRAGHDVVILEQVSQIGEVGAGIQMAPNAARILGRFGLLQKIMESANVLKESSSRRWQNDEEIGTAPLMPKVESLQFCYKSEVLKSHDRLLRSIKHHYS